MALTLKTFVRAQGVTQFAGEHVLAGERVTVGRSAGCTLKLDDPQRLLSRVHVEFLRIAGGYRLKVASTHYPVTVNGREYPPGSEVTVRTGDCLAMDVHELEIVGTGDDAPAVVAPAVVPHVVVHQPAVHRPAALVAVPRVEVQAVETNAAQVYRAQAPVAPVTILAARGGWGAKRLGLVAAVIAGVVIAGAALKGVLPDGEAAKQAEQEIARLEAVAKSMLKLVESDRQEVKEAVTIAGQEVERLKAQVSTARAGAERQNAEAEVLEALQTARLNAGLEQGLRRFAESPEGLPRIEGSLAAAAAADRAKDRTGALKQLGEANAALTQMRAKIADERKTLQAELIRRREAFQVAQGQARAQDDARATADARARTESLERAKAASDARSRAANEGIAKAKAEASARAEAETRARNEADARASADADARAKAASEARARAEAAATARADAAERAAAAAAARQEAAAARQEAAAAARAKADSDRQNAEAVFGIIRSFAR